MENQGLIYKITNITNGKIYIGKTKTVYGQSMFGIEKRFKQHLYNAFCTKRMKECPILYSAIRKYGKDSFRIELVCECPLEDVDDNEIKCIRDHNATDRDIGYNIALGGMGRSVVDVSEEIRLKISKSQNAENMNIKPYYKNSVLIGYRVKRRVKGVQHQKHFTSNKNTPEENYRLAKEWLDDLINGKLNNNKYNRKYYLPRNIHYSIKNDIIIGFCVSVMINGKKYHKSFQDSNSELDDMLKKAIEYKNSLLNKVDQEGNLTKKSAA